MATVAKLSITPVKSTALVHPDEIRLEPWGAVGNRSFYLVDELNRLFTGSRLGRLVRIASDYDAIEERVTLRFPDDQTIDGHADALGRTVSTDFWGRMVAGREVRGPFEQALSDFAGRWIRMIRPDRAGDANDVWPASLVSQASADDLARRAGREEPRDARRFRMLIDLDGCEPWEEDSWIGLFVRVGEALLRIPGAIPRCVVTTQDPSSGARDNPTLKQIRVHRSIGKGEDLPFGVYGEILEPGTVRVGDRIDLTG